MELASGAHTLRVAADGPEKQRVSIVDKAAEYSLVHNGNEIWAYDSGSNTAVHSTAPGRRPARQAAPGAQGPPRRPEGRHPAGARRSRH